LAVDTLPVHYIAVDGPIGVGKTTLVELLSARFEGVKLLEDVSNPFLPAFYEDRPGAAFQTELYFLLSRYKQQQDVAQRNLFDRLLVADYTFPKNRIFAYLNLSDDELMLFDKLYTLLEPQLAKPDLVIYLTADIDTCLRRIDKRKREFERSMSADYLNELVDAYNHYYHYYDASPLLVVDTRKLNFVEREDHFDDLVRQIAAPVRGTKYYVPA
jgi:deoxyadenosine/deoxycytidine kinase